MRTWLLVLMALVLTGRLIAAPLETIVLEADNLTCPACSITIERALDRVPGIADTNVDTAAGTVMVTFDPQRTNTPEIARAITEAGFPAAAQSHDD